MLHIGYYVQQSAFDKCTQTDINPQTAARKLEGRFVSGYLENSLQLDLLAFSPATTFPGNPQVYFPGSTRHGPSGDMIECPVVNLPFLKHLSRFVGSLINIFRWCRRVPPEGRVLSVYSVHTPFLLSCVLAKLRYGARFFVIVPDLPQFMNHGRHKNRVTRALKRIDLAIISHLMSKASGFAVITERTGLRLCEAKPIPFVVIEAIADIEAFPMPVDSLYPKKVFLYTGGLTTGYGVSDLLIAFEQISAGRNDIELWLCGRGELVPHIEGLAAENPAIRYLGYLSQDNLNQIFPDVFCFINSRDPDGEFVKYSFPSKLLEYMVTGIPVLTTRLSGVPREYDEYLNFIEGAGPHCIKVGVEELLLEDISTLREKGLGARQFAMSQKTAAVQVGKFLRLIDTKVEYNVR